MPRQAVQTIGWPAHTAVIPAHAGIQWLLDVDARVRGNDGVVGCAGVAAHPASCT
jgi:hypothetical protein